MGGNSTSFFMDNSNMATNSGSGSSWGGANNNVPGGQSTKNECNNDNNQLTMSEWIQLHEDFDSNLTHQHKIIKQMRDLKTSKGIKYILEDRALSVDAPNSLSNKEVTDLSNRVGIIDRIITTKFDEFKELEAKDLRSHIRIAHIFTHRKNQFARQYNDLFEK